MIKTAHQLLHALVNHRQVTVVVGKGFVAQPNYLISLFDGCWALPPLSLSSCGPSLMVPPKPRWRVPYSRRWLLEKGLGLIVFVQDIPSLDLFPSFLP